MMRMENGSDTESKESDNEIRGRSVSLEQGYVHEVYDRIADDLFSAPVDHRSPILNFLEELEPGSLVADVGCGGGKHLNLQKSVFTLGLDRCSKLLKQAKVIKNKPCDILEADNLNLPYRDGSMDAAISVSVVHHFATRGRRALALRELARILRIGGKLLIIVQGDHLKCESRDVLMPWYKDPKRKHSTSISSKVDDDVVNFDVKDKLNSFGEYIYDADDDDDDVSVPSSDEEDALVPDEYSVYTAAKFKYYSQNGKETSREGSEESGQASSSVESCYGFVRNVLKRLSSQPTPSVLPSDDFPYTISKNCGHISQPTSPIKHLTSGIECQSFPSSTNIESIIKNDIIELRNVDDPDEAAITLSSYESHKKEQSAPSGTMQHTTSPAVSESGKGLVKSLSGFFKKLPPFISKRNSLPANWSKFQRQVSQQLNHRFTSPCSISNDRSKLVRSKTTATCTINYEPYPNLESVEEILGGTDDEFYNEGERVDCRNRHLSHDRKEKGYNRIEFIKDDIVNGNLGMEINDYYLYADDDYFSKHHISHLKQPRNFDCLKYDSLEFSDIQHKPYSAYINSKYDLSTFPKRDIEQSSKLSQRTFNFSDEPAGAKDYHKQNKAMSTQCQMNQSLLNDCAYHDDNITFASTNIIDNEFFDDFNDISISSMDKPVSNKRTMNDDIEDVYEHLKTLKFDEWSGSPKRCKRTSYPNYQMVPSKTSGPFYDSDDELEDQGVVLSSYYSMPELCKLADYYQEYIFPNKNYSRRKQGPDIETLATLNNPTIVKDSLGNYILDDVSESKRMNFGNGRSDIKMYNENSFQRNLSHRKLSDLVELQEENAVLFESEGDLESLDDTLSKDVKVSIQRNDGKKLDPGSSAEMSYAANDKVQDFKRRHSLVILDSMDHRRSDGSDCIKENGEVISRPTSVFLDCEECCSYLMSDNSSPDSANILTRNSTELIFPQAGKENPHETRGTKGFESTELKRQEPSSHTDKIVEQHLTNSNKGAGNKNTFNATCLSAFSQSGATDWQQEHSNDPEICSYSPKSPITLERTNCLLKENMSTFKASQTIDCVSSLLENLNSDLPHNGTNQNVETFFLEHDEKYLAKIEALNLKNEQISSEKQSELISVDELFSFDDIYSDLKGTNELEIEESASYSPDLCLMNYELDHAMKYGVNSLYKTPEPSIKPYEKTICAGNSEMTNELKSNPEHGLIDTKVPLELYSNTADTCNTRQETQRSTDRAQQRDNCFSRRSDRMGNDETVDLESAKAENSWKTHKPTSADQEIPMEHCADSSTFSCERNLPTDEDDSTEVHPLHGYVSEPCATLDTHRYFHVFQEHELEHLIEENVEDLHVIRSFRHQNSWCVIAEKVQVWTI